MDLPLRPLGGRHSFSRGKMDTKFAKFLQENGIDSRRIAASSRVLERLLPADRQLKLLKRLSKKEDAAPSEATKEKIKQKPRSGRPATPRLVQAALSGKPVPGPGKTRLVKAVNRLLEQKKKPATDLRTLF